MVMCARCCGRYFVMYTVGIYLFWYIYFWYIFWCVILSVDIPHLLSNICGQLLYSFSCSISDLNMIILLLDVVIFVEKSSCVKLSYLDRVTLLWQCILTEVAKVLSGC